MVANRINELLVSVSSTLPRLTDDLAVFDVQDEIPAEYVISVMTTENALQQISVNKAVGPYNVPALVLSSVSKAGKRVYMLYQLKRAGISNNDMVKMYVSIIRPVLEYACPVMEYKFAKIFIRCN